MTGWESIVIAISVAVIALGMLILFIGFAVLFFSLRKLLSQTKNLVKAFTSDDDPVSEIVSGIKKMFNMNPSKKNEGKILSVIKGALLGVTLWQEFKRRK